MAKNRLDYQAQLSRHSHDVSAGYASSLCTGAIVPQYFDILGPGDTIYYNTRLFARLQDVVTAFLGEIDLHVDYFFVPLQMLYTPFGQIFAQTDDFLSSLYRDLSARDSFPLLSVIETLEYEGCKPWQYLMRNQECFGKGAMRLLNGVNANALGLLNETQRDAFFEYLGDDAPDPGSISAYFTRLGSCPPMTPWALCAYQAIYQKYYRNDEFERLSVMDYNIDMYYNQAKFVNDRLLRLRYCQRPSDYFTTTRVSPITSAVNKLGGATTDDSNIFPLNGGQLTNMLTKVNDYLGFASSDFVYNVKGSNNSNIYPNSSDPVLGENYSSFVSTSVAQNKDWFPSAANIRALFAIDKFTRIYGRADKTYDDQILAHFGIKIPHDIKHDLTHLKHYRVVLQSDPIYGTANIPNTDQSALISTLGQVGGQGQCEISTLNGEPEKFTAPVHGVFMAVCYAVTKPRYVLTYDKLHTLRNRLSFPIPEFDKLGAQPLYNFEFNPIYLESDWSTVGNPDNRMSMRSGWQNRYQEFKKKYNRASLVYLDYQTLPEFIGVPRPGYDNPQQLHRPTAENIYSPWMISKPAFDLYYSQALPSSVSSNLLRADNFFERCDSLDTIMVSRLKKGWDVSYYNDPASIFQTDPILTEFFCQAKKVSWMSETGEPDL